AARRQRQKAVADANAAGAVLLQFTGKASQSPERLLPSAGAERTVELFIKREFPVSRQIWRGGSRTAQTDPPHANEKRRCTKTIRHRDLPWKMRDKLVATDGAGTDRPWSAGCSSPTAPPISSASARCE